MEASYQKNGGFFLVKCQKLGEIIERFAAYTMHRNNTVNSYLYL